MQSSSKKIAKHSVGLLVMLSMMGAAPAHAWSMSDLPLIGSFFGGNQRQQQQNTQMQPQASMYNGMGQGQQVQSWQVPQAGASYAYSVPQQVLLGTAVGLAVSSAIKGNNNNNGQPQRNPMVDILNVYGAMGMAGGQQRYPGAVQQGGWVYNAPPPVYQQQVPQYQILAQNNQTWGYNNTPYGNYPYAGENPYANPVPMPKPNVTWQGGQDPYAGAIPMPKPGVTWQGGQDPYAGAIPMPKPGATVNTSLGGTTTSTGGNYRWPVGTNSSGSSNYVSSVYGLRDRDNFDTGCINGTKDASRCGNKMHDGIDLAAPYGTPLQSMGDAKIVRISPYCNNPKSKAAYNPDGFTNAPGEGCSITTYNSQTGDSFTYMHLSDASAVKVGDQVKDGQIIGKTGNSGGSSGAHLHVGACQVSQAQMDKALASGKNVGSCSAIGGKSVNPLDKVDSKDPRTANARKEEQINKEYLACKQKAGTDKAAVAQCRKERNDKRAKNKADRGKKKDEKTDSNLTGKLNMNRP